MMTSLGTPKNLEQAIKNGQMQAHLNLESSNSSAVIAKHVMDFLAQKFSTAYLEDSTVEQVWEILKQKQKEIA